MANQPYDAFLVTLSDWSAQGAREAQSRLKGCPSGAPSSYELFATGARVRMREYPQITATVHCPNSDGTVTIQLTADGEYQVVFPSEIEAY